MGYVYKSYRKDEMAARLLETALQLHANGGDGFSLILLARSAEEVLAGMIKGRRSGTPTTGPAERTAREETKAVLGTIHAAHGSGRTEKQIGDSMNRVFNSIKHHDSGKDAEEITLSLELEVEMALSGAIENYARYFGNPSESMVRFTQDRLRNCGAP